MTNFIRGVLFAPTKGVSFIAEVDLDYPEELHDAHNSYPMAPCPVRATLFFVHTNDTSL